MSSLRNPRTRYSRSAARAGRGGHRSSRRPRPAARPQAAGWAEAGRATGAPRWKGTGPGERQRGHRSLSDPEHATHEFTSRRGPVPLTRSTQQPSPRRTQSSPELEPCLRPENHQPSRAGVPDRHRLVSAGGRHAGEGRGLQLQRSAQPLDDALPERETAGSLNGPLGDVREQGANGEGQRARVRDPRRAPLFGRGSLHRTVGHLHHPGEDP